MWRRTFKSWAVGACAAVLIALLAGPAVGADKKDKKQGDQARDAIDKQKDIANALKDKAKGGPDTQKSDDAKADPLQKQLDDLKDKLQKEKDRHAAALEPLNKDLKAQT
ncbi:MAG: hypothetical protein JWO31_2397, partial [Phycisphaerales bacterium]|nr:hypothetical protein [Phycisphaerales bacterium]